jgi:hypothetical protein
VFGEPSFYFAVRFAIPALRTVALLEPKRKNLPFWVLQIAPNLKALIDAAQTTFYFVDLFLFVSCGKEISLKIVVSARPSFNYLEFITIFVPD